MRLVLAFALLACIACGNPPGPAPVATPTTQASPSTAPSTLPSAGADVCHVSGATYCALDGRVSQANLTATICSGHWSSTVRPPASTTGAWKARDFIDLPRPMDAQGQPITSFSQAEGDHRLAIGLGGDPGAVLVNGRWQETSQVLVVGPDRLPINFALEFPASPNPKDGAETKLHNEVCAGQLTLLQAQSELISQWLGPFPAYRQ